MASPRLYKTEGIILRRRCFRDVDRIVTIFTKDYGKISAVARGVRRITSRRAPHLEVFTRVMLLLFRAQAMDSIQEVTPVLTYPGIRKDMKKISVAYLLCELVDSLAAQQQEHRDVYTLLCKSLARLDVGDTDSTYMVSRQFSQELLWNLGFLPRTTVLTSYRMQSFIEDIAQKKLVTPAFARKVVSMV